jgi:16S rRNA (cytidine1402-2'-O)-methyltransferase
MKRKDHPRSAVHGAGASGARLFIIGTPIGNLEDLTFRALRLLKEVDLIACEDTRRTQKLLNFFNIKTPTISYHEHNEMTRAPELIVEMEGGSHVALVSDAGMPGISDPGYRLVHLAIRHGIPVVPVPGASAFLAALAASGLPVDQFRFLGFLPPKEGARRQALKQLESATKTLVFYESPHRVVDMLEDVHDLLGDRPVVVAREVTKLHEEFLRGSVSEVLDRLRRKPPRGEFTVLVGRPGTGAGSTPRSAPLQPEVTRLMTEQNLDLRGALKAIARARGISRSEDYRLYQMEKSASP